MPSPLLTTLAGGPAPRIVFTSAGSLAEDAATGTVVGSFAVINGSGSYTFSLIEDSGGLFAVDGSNLETAGALDYETAASHSLTVEADNGVDAPIWLSFSVPVTDVEPEATGLAAIVAAMAPGEWKLLGPDLTAQPGSINDVQAELNTDNYGAVFGDNGTVETVCKAILPDGISAWSRIAVGSGRWAGWVFYWGAGHNDGACNQVFGINLNLANPVWVAMTLQNPLAGTADADYPTTQNVQTYYYQSHPVTGEEGAPSGHGAYGGLLFDEHNDRLIFLTGAVFNNSGTYRGTFYLDLSGITDLEGMTDITDGVWSHVTHADTDNYINATPMIPPGYTGTSVWYCRNWRDAVVRIDQDGTLTECARFDGGVGDQQSNKLMVPNLDGDSGDWDVIGFGTGTVTVWSRVVLSPSDALPSNNSSIAATVAGDTADWRDSCGFARRTADGKIYALTGLVNGTVQSITLSGNRTSGVTATVADVSVSGEVPGAGVYDQTALEVRDLDTLTAGEGGAVCGKWGYMPDHDVFVLLHDYSNAKVSIWKPPAVA